MIDDPTPEQPLDVVALMAECARQEAWCRDHGFPNPQIDTVDVRALLQHGRRATVPERVAAQRG